MGSNYKMKYNVDIVMCIDATGSMGNLLDTVKGNALKLYPDLTKAMDEKGKHINELRVRVIAFRDYIADQEEAMLATRFYSLPEEDAEFESVLKSIEPKGGGDEPEDGLEALAYAMKSPWMNEGDKRRQIIVVWSDEGTHMLGFGKTAPNYPKGMSRDFEELTQWWGDSEQPGVMDYHAKRLLIYAPEKRYWTDIVDTWDNVLYFPSEAGNGLENLEYSEILNGIANSI